MKILSREEEFLFANRHSIDSENVCRTLLKNGLQPGPLTTAKV
jgi:hypothetical protein